LVCFRLNEFRQPTIIEQLKRKIEQR
jgi:hypothetical protein